MTRTQTEINLAELNHLGAEQLLKYAFERFAPRAAVGTSLQKTGIVIIDLASRLGVDYRVFFVDTLMNHRETYELLERIENRYGITVEKYCPDPDDVEKLRRSVGQYAHFFARELCCRVRKFRPLQRALATLDVWISGLRKDQSEHRDKTARRALWTKDESGRRILKLNPLLDWTDDDIEQYTREHDLPYNELYDYRSPYGERYTVIGCKCCHVPVRDDFPRRAGKFPWEQGAKECGLHTNGSGI